jgi:hypothetical protein
VPGLKEELAAEKRMLKKEREDIEDEKFVVFSCSFPILATFSDLLACLYRQRLSEVADGINQKSEETVRLHSDAARFVACEIQQQHEHAHNTTCTLFRKREEAQQMLAASEALSVKCANEMARVKQAEQALKQREEDIREQRIELAKERGAVGFLRTAVLPDPETASSTEGKGYTAAPVAAVSVTQVPLLVSSVATQRATPPRLVQTQQKVKRWNAQLDEVTVRLFVGFFSLHIGSVEIFLSLQDLQQLTSQRRLLTQLNR